MTQTLTIARREMQEKRFVFLTAALLAIIPYICTILPGLRNWDSRQMIIAVAGFLAVGFPLGLSLVLGGSMVGRELSERRLSFYFARPLAASSIWFGKLLGGLAMVAASFCIIFLPALAVARGAWDRSWSFDLGTAVTAMFGLALLFMLLANAVGTMLRSHSAILMVDVVMAVVIGVAAWYVLAAPLKVMAWSLFAGMCVALLGVVIVALVGAGAWQLSRGRTERRQSHRALSTFLWSAIAIGLALLGLYSLWVFSAGLSDIHGQLAARTARRGPWAVVSGNVRGRGDYRPVLLVNSVTGASERMPIGGPEYMFGNAFITGDGKTAMWVDRYGLHETRGELMMRPLGDAAGAVHGTNITVSLSGNMVVPSDDGSRVAVYAYGNNQLTLYDTQRGASLGTLQTPLPNHSWLMWANDHVVRIYSDVSQAKSKVVAPRTLEIHEFDAQRRVLEKVGEAHTIGRGVTLTINADGTRILLRSLLFGADERRAAPAYVVCDARSGQQLAVPSIPADAETANGTFLGDNRLVLPLTMGGQSLLRICAPDGTTLRDIALGAGRPMVGSLMAPGRFLVASFSGTPMNETNGNGFVSTIVDVDRGTVVARESGYRPLHDQWSGYNGEPRRAVDASGSGPQLFVDGKGQMVLWNGATLEKKVVAGG